MRNGSNSAGTGTTLQDKDFLVPCRLWMEALSLTVHPNDTHPYIKLNHEPHHEHNQLPGGSTLLCREGKGSIPNLHPMIYELFKFCVTYALPVHLFNNLFTSFDANAHKINNTTALVA